MRKKWTKLHMLSWVIERVHFVDQKQVQIWMPGGAPVAVMIRREDGVPVLEGYLDDYYASYEEDTVLVNETSAPGNYFNPFGTEEDDIAPIDVLGLNEEEGKVAPPPTELEEQMKDGVHEDSICLLLGDWFRMPQIL